MAEKRVKVVLTGFYTVDMDEAEQDYGTTDLVEMLKIDQVNADANPESIIDWLDSKPTVVLNWED